METNYRGDRLSEYNNIIKENDNIYRGLARNMGLSECSFWILYILRSECAALAQSDVCNFLFQPKQSINSALKKMESDGYIELVHETDQRSKKIILTPEGVRFCEETVDRVIALERRALGSLPEDEQKLFLSLFRKYTDILKGCMEEILKK